MTFYAASFIQALPSFHLVPFLRGQLANMDVTAKKHSIEHFEFAEGTGSDTTAFVIDPIAEKKLLRKIDLRILPP